MNRELENDEALELLMDQAIDHPLPEDKQIEAAHPMESGNHAAFQEAMRLVGARHSKSGPVNLVNWLLVRRQEALHDRDSWRRVAERLETEKQELRRSK